jgi:hypothetical protein
MPGRRPRVSPTAPGPARRRSMTTGQAEHPVNRVISRPRKVVQNETSCDQETGSGAADRARAGDQHRRGRSPCRYRPTRLRAASTIEPVSMRWMR